VVTIVPAKSEADRRIARLREVTARMERRRQEVADDAKQRAADVAWLRAKGYTLQRIADEIGVTKEAVAKIASRNG
jgi:predicted transcriptional regulator